jgi:hypothetical protein
VRTRTSRGLDRETLEFFLDPSRGVFRKLDGCHTPFPGVSPIFCPFGGTGGVVLWGELPRRGHPGVGGRGSKMTRNRTKKKHETGCFVTTKQPVFETQCLKRELNRRLIYECRCDERLKVKAERSVMKD